MTTMTTTVCSERVYDRSYPIRGRGCTHTAVVERTETRVDRTPRRVYDEATFTFTTEYDELTVEMRRAYCHQHDPVARKEREDKKYAAESRERGTKLSREAALAVIADGLVGQLKALGVTASEHYVADHSAGASRYRTTPTGCVVIGPESVSKLMEMAARLAEYESR